MTTLYRLVVTLPEGSQQPGWQPPDWPDICDENGWSESHGGATLAREWPGWPKRRMWFSLAAAAKAAEYLERCGATAVLQHSHPVTWPAMVQLRLPVMPDGPAACHLCGAATGAHAPDLVLVGTVHGWECAGSQDCLSRQKAAGGELS